MRGSCCSLYFEVMLKGLFHIGMASVFAMAVGLFARDVIGSGVADWILFFGFVGGCLTVAQYMMVKMLTDKKSDSDK